MKIKIKRVTAFSETKNGGNPAGIVLESPYLSCDQMKYISKILKVSETAFVYPSKIADYKLRFFSPEVEVDLCGHATIATFFTLAVKGFFSNCKVINVTQETKAGILPVEIYFNKIGLVQRVMMTLGNPKLLDINFDVLKIANSLNISIDKIDNLLPNQIASTGLFTLPICIDSFKTLKNIKPNFEKIKKICLKLSVGSIHLFTFDTIESNSVYHARNFAPLYGINEDPVTGTANGSICYYLLKNKIIKDKYLKCEQGDIIGRPGRVLVDIEKSRVKIGGIAKIVEEKEIDYIL
jgi:PhzF family phenazine biosynthesis protein